MKPPNDPNAGFDDATPAASGSPTSVNVLEILRDIRAGMRTRGFLDKYGITLQQFEGLLKNLLRRRLLTVEEFKEWKAKKPQPSPAQQASIPPPPRPPEELPQQAAPSQNVETFIITNPEKNNSWALQLFSAQRDRMRGAKFKVSLHGKKYFFVVEEMVFRGQVEMLAGALGSKSAPRTKREEALEFISRHGWSAYLERRALEANVDDEEQAPSGKKARLVLLHCRNDTYLAALHTPAPAINLYVGNCLEKLRNRLSKSVDLSPLDA
jgi:hypothetical protein